MSNTTAAVEPEKTETISSVQNFIVSINKDYILIFPFYGIDIKDELKKQVCNGNIV